MLIISARHGAYPPKVDRATVIRRSLAQIGELRKGFVAVLFFYSENHHFLKTYFRHIFLFNVLVF